MAGKKIPILIKDDPWLNPYVEEINGRIDRFKDQLGIIEKESGSLENFSSAYNYLGINYDGDKDGWWYREWAPGAHALYLTGDFNDWKKHTHPLKKNEFGVWEIFLSEKEN